MLGFRAHVGYASRTDADRLQPQIDQLRYEPRVAGQFPTQGNRFARLMRAIDELLQQYSLDTHEGLMLMCLAEAMLRIPDKATADALIEDKLGPSDWKSYLGQSESWFVNAGYQLFF